MTDQIEDLFADLRAGEVPVLRPPGTEPLRRAARRRRATLSAAAGVAVVALAGLALIVRPGGAGTTPAATPASLPPRYPAVQLTESVAADLGINPDRSGPGQIFSNTAEGPLESRRELLGGTYDVRMSCWGAGSMEVTVSAGGVGSVPATTVTTVPCGEQDADARLRTVTVPVAEPRGDLTVRVVPSVAGPGRAGFGYLPVMVGGDRERWSQEAMTALGESEEGTFQMGGGEVVGDGNITGYSHESVENRPYRVRGICLGSGTVTLAVSRDVDANDAKKTRLRCSAAGSLASVTYTPVNEIHISFEADDDALGRAVVAMVLETA